MVEVIYTGPISAPVQTQDSLEGLYVPGRAGECRWGEGCLGFSPGPDLR